eukprot:scaffold2882_cov434-Prasinococcus_capsulatus_cf.AAC.14
MLRALLPFQYAASSPTHPLRAISFGDRGCAPVGSFRACGMCTATDTSAVTDPSFARHIDCVELPTRTRDLARLPNGWPLQALLSRRYMNCTFQAKNARPSSAWPVVPVPIHDALRFAVSRHPRRWIPDGIQGKGIPRQYWAMRETK